MKRIFIFFLSISILLGAVGCHKKTADEKLRAAELKVRSGDLIGARIDLKELLKKYPDDPSAANARFLLAQCYFQEQDFPQCRQHLLRIFKKLGTSDERGRIAFENVLATYRAEKKYEQGIREAKALLKKLPMDDPFAFRVKFLVCGLLDEDNKTTDAISALAKLIPTGKDERERSVALERLVAIYARLKKYDDAIAIYADYAQKYPDSKNINDLIVGQAYYYALKGDTKKAEELYGKAHKGFQEAIKKTLDKGERAELSFRQAKTFELQKKFAEARAKYKYIKENYADTPLYHPAILSFGDAYVIENKPEKALEYFQGILNSEQKDRQLILNVRRRIAALLRARAQTKAASAPTTKSLEQKPLIPKALQR